MRRKDREITDPSQIMDILRKADVCHIAMCDENVPYVVTMNFGLGRDGFSPLYFHCASEGKKINILKKNNLVCFQADIEHELFLHSETSCGCSMSYQSVVGMGKMTFVTELSEKIEALRAIMTHYTNKSEHTFKDELIERTLILRLDVEDISGKARLKPEHQNAT